MKSRTKSTSKRDVKKVHADHPPKRTKKKDGTKVKSDTKIIQRVKKKTAVTHYDIKPLVISSASSDNEPIFISSASDNEPILIRSSMEHSSDSEPSVIKSGNTYPSLTDSSSDNEPAVSQQRNVHINPSRYIPVTSDMGGCTDFSDNERSSDILPSSSSEVESSGLSSDTG